LFKLSNTKTKNNAKKRRKPLKKQTKHVSKATLCRNPKLPMGLRNSVNNAFTTKNYVMQNFVRFSIILIKKS